MAYSCKGAFPVLLSLLLYAFSYPAFAAGAVTILHAFDGNDGETPVGRLIEGDGGSFYGVTQSGGADDCGTIYRIKPDGAHELLHSFIDALHGCEPESGLTRGPETAETFYGVARFGGNSGVGTAYRITPAGDFEVVHHFAFPGDTPRAPVGRLLLVGENFYGTSSGPGSGRLFRLTSEGEVTVIYTFTGGEDGGFPHTGLTEGPDGSLYGTTLFGGEDGLSTSDGVIYRVTPGDSVPWDFEVLHAFGAADASDGKSHLYDGPLALGPDGNFYGTTTQGGGSALGLAYRITPDGEYTAFDVFSGFDGVAVLGGPGGGLTLADDGNFYGSASTFFRMTTAGAVTRLTDATLPGGATAGAVVQSGAGSFHGVSREGPGLGNGRVFRISGLSIDGGGGGTGDGNGDDDAGASGGGGSSDIASLGVLILMLLLSPYRRVHAGVQALRTGEAGGGNDMPCGMGGTMQPIPALPHQAHEYRAE